MTPNERLQYILGRLLMEKGPEFLWQELKAYKPEDRNDRARLKRSLLKAIEIAKSLKE